MARDFGHKHIRPQAQIFRRLDPAFRSDFLIFEKLSRGGLERIARQVGSKFQHVALDVFEIQPVERAVEVRHRYFFSIRHTDGARQRAFQILEQFPGAQFVRFLRQVVSERAQRVQVLFVGERFQVPPKAHVQGIGLQILQQNPELHGPVLRRVGFDDAILAQAGFESRDRGEHRALIWLIGSYPGSISPEAQAPVRCADKQ
jgi:hypothetical protein